MFTKTVKYVDYNGVERTEEFCFNLSKGELLEMEMSRGDGFSTHIQKIVDAKETDKLFSLFKSMILQSYGVKSEDGRRFVKSDKLREEFEQTEAYSQIIMELAMDPEAAAAFINAVIPGDLKEKLDQVQAIKPTDN